MLTRGAGGRAAPVPSLSEVVPMSTYEELSLIVSVALLIVAILNLTQSPPPVKRVARRTAISL